MKLRSTLFFAAAALLLTPEFAHACSTCIATGEDNRSAFEMMTWIISVVPLAMIGGVCLWLYRRVKKLEKQQAQQSLAN